MLTTLNVRATEFTIGPDRPWSMPVALPPSSGYTYAAEFSVDEALAAGALDVQFDRPIYTYVENFLNFPVGGGGAGPVVAVAQVVVEVRAAAMAPTTGVPATLDHRVPPAGPRRSDPDRRCEQSRRKWARLPHLRRMGRSFHNQQRASERQFRENSGNE